MGGVFNCAGTYEYVLSLIMGLGWSVRQTG